jgi:hypothetical protein
MHATLARSARIRCRPSNHISVAQPVASGTPPAACGLLACHDLLCQAVCGRRGVNERTSSLVRSSCGGLQPRPRPRPRPRSPSSHVAGGARRGGSAAVRRLAGASSAAGWSLRGLLGSSVRAILSPCQPAAAKKGGRIAED